MKKLAVATVFAVVLAAVILVVAVLPAEYGIDPLGIGGALGLTQLAEEGGAAAPQDLKALAEAKPTPIGNKQLATPPVLVDWNRSSTSRYKVDSRKYELPPGGKMEFKYQMKKGIEPRLLVGEHSKGQVRVPRRAERRPGRHVSKLRDR